MSHRTFIHTHRVTYAQCTIGNHVYYARYLDLLEEARGEFFRGIGITFQQLHDDGTIFPVVEAHILYKGAARYDDVLRIELWITEIGRVRVNLGARILNAEQRLLVEATTFHACTSLDDKPMRMPEELVLKLKPYLASAAPA